MDFTRLIIRPDGKNIAFPTHLFLFITLMFGIAFVLPPGVLAAASSPLWTFSSQAGVGLWWGWGLIAVSVMNTLMLLTRSVLLARITGALGFCLWLYATFAYLYIGFWLGLLASAIPNVLFWGWYAIQVAKFRYSMKE